MASAIDDAHLSLIRFDPSRPYDKVVPPENGAHVMQDGVYFGADGRIAAYFVDKSLRDRLERLRIKKLADAEAEKARKAALIRLGADPDDGSLNGLSDDELDEKVDASGKSDNADTTIDLIAWARGEKVYRLTVLRKAAREQYSTDIKDKKNLLEFMIENDFITEDEAKADINSK